MKEISMKLVFFSIILAAPILSGQTLKAPTVPDKIADQFAPAPYAGQRIEGVLGDRMRVNLEGRLLHLDEKAVLQSFQHRPGEHPWAGEHVDKFLHAAVNTWLYTHDERLKTLMDRVARELVATLLPDG